MKKLFTLALMCMMMFCGLAQDPGTLDETYGVEGTVDFNPCNNIDMYPRVHVQDDGKILIVSKSRKDGANYYIGVTRQNPDGSIDETYGENGHAFFQQQMVYLNEPMATVLGDDGQLYIAGHIYADGAMNKGYILCIDQNGFANPYFGEEGYALYDRDNTVFYAIAIDSQGRVYVGGNTTSGAYDVALVQRYSAEGQLDTSFANNGNLILQETEVSSYIYSLCVVEDDKLLVGGLMYIPKDGFTSRIQDPRMWRVNQDGTLDETFGDGGCFTLSINEINASINDMDVQSDGKYIVAGWIETSDLNSDQVGRSEVFVTRVGLDGTMDMSFGENNDGMMIYDILSGSDGCRNMCKDIVVAHDDQIFGTVYTYNLVTATNSRVYVYNMNPDGTPNEDFAGAGLVPVPWEDIEVQSSGVDLQKDGKLLVTGYLYDGSIDYRLMSSRYYTSVAPEQGEEDGVSEIDIEVEVLTSTSAKVTITPNEYTSEYFYGILPKEEYNEYGEEFWIDYLYEYGMPTVGAVSGEVDDLEANTEYYVMAFGYNAAGERGEVALADFSTVGCIELNDIQFTVYPNPASEMIFVETEINEDAQVSILDVTGRCVKQVELSENVSSINIEDVESGVYFIKVQQGDNNSVRKLIVR